MTVNLTIRQIQSLGACRGSGLTGFLLDDRLVRQPDPEVAQICWRCPIREGCLAYALETEVDEGEAGVWGGTTPFQRELLKVERSRVKCPYCESTGVFPTGRGEICMSCGHSWLV